MAKRPHQTEPHTVPQTAAAPEPPPKGSDRELMALVHHFADLLADRDPWQIERVLATLDTFFPRKMRIEASRSVEGMT